MSWESYRKLDDEKQVNEDPKDYTWEKQKIPILHTGFTELTVGARPKGRLSLTLMLVRGSYRVKLYDRVSQKSAWMELETLECFLEVVESHVKNHLLTWENDQWKP